MAGEPNQNNIKTTDASITKSTENLYDPKTSQDENKRFFAEQAGQGHFAGLNISVSSSSSTEESQKEKNEKKLDRLQHLIILQDRLNDLNGQIALTEDEIKALKVDIGRLEESIAQKTEQLNQHAEHYAKLERTSEVQKEQIEQTRALKEEADLAREKVQAQIIENDEALQNIQERMGESHGNGLTGKNHLYDENGNLLTVDEKGELTTATETEKGLVILSDSLARVESWMPKSMLDAMSLKQIETTGTINRAEYEERLRNQELLHYKLEDCKDQCTELDRQLELDVDAYNKTITAMRVEKDSIDQLRTEIENETGDVTNKKQELQEKEEKLHELQQEREIIQERIIDADEHQKVSSIFNKESGINTDHDHTTAAEQDENQDFTFERDLEQVAALEKIKTEIGGSTSMTLAQLEDLMPGASESFMDKIKATLGRMDIDINEQIPGISKDVPRITGHKNELEPNGLREKISGIFAQEANPEEPKVTLAPKIENELHQPGPTVPTGGLAA